MSNIYTERRVISRENTEVNNFQELIAYSILSLSIANVVLSVLNIVTTVELFALIGALMYKNFVTTDRN